MKVVVFGGSGYIGRHTIPYLVQAGHEVTAVYATNKPSATLEQVQYIEGNVLDHERVRDIVEGAQVVYNFAALADIHACLDRPAEAIQINMLGAQHILEACVRSHITRYVQASSVYAHSKNGGIYSITKRFAEELVFFYHNNYHLDYTVLRYGTIYGPEEGQGNSLYRYITQALTTGRVEYPGSGNELREYIHIEDAARLSTVILEEEYKNKVMVISGLHPYTARDVLETVNEMMHGTIELIYGDGTPAQHYIRTPYQFFETTAKKMISTDYIDIQQGLMDCIVKISKKLKDGNDLYEHL